MAFNRDGLSRNGSGQGNSQAVWAYHTTDPIALMLSNAYFDDAQSEMKRGDLIYLWDDTLATQTLSYVVTSAPDGVGVNLATGMLIPA
jgi:hypothetical protein